jgi:type VI protein secretion system component VasF
VDHEPTTSQQRRAPAWVIITVWAIAACLAGAVITGMFLY